MAHPDVIKFLESRTIHPRSGEIDLLLEQAVGICRAEGKFSITLLRNRLHIGSHRASNLIKMMNLSNVQLVPMEKVKPSKKSVALRKLNQRAVAPPPTYQQPPPVVIAPPPPAPPPEDDVPEDIRAFADMTLRQIITRYGNDQAFVDWLKATRMIEDIASARMKNAKTAGELASVELIKRGIFDPINTVYQTLLTDGAKTITQTVYTMTKANAEMIECELEVISQMTTLIRSAKAKMKKCLKSV